MKKIKHYKKILIVKPSSLGDIVHSLPFLNSIRSCFPKAEIHWVVAKGFEDILDENPMIDKLIVINKDMWKKILKTGETIKEVKTLFSRLKSERYDLVVDLQGLFRSGMITMATRAPERVGFAEAREGSRLFYNIKVKGGKGVHAVDRYMKVAGAIGCDTGNIIFPFPLFKNDLKEIKKIKNGMKDYAVLVPGARWDTKMWPAEYYGKLASMLPMKTFVIGSSKDMVLAEKVVKASKGKAFSLIGKTNLKELIDILRDARMVVSNDTGPMHIAAGLRVPVVAIFGPTSPAKTAPYGQGHIIIKSEEKCAPCFKKKCRNMKCMREIYVDMVFKKISEGLDL